MTGGVNGEMLTTLYLENIFGIKSVLFCFFPSADGVISGLWRSTRTKVR